MPSVMKKNKKNEVNNNTYEVNKEKDPNEPNLKGDRLNVALLVFLYTLQSIPHGLIQAIPLILQNRRNQAEFTLVAYPFDLKLMWAPIVDCVYTRLFGRRKSWLIPVQYLLGMTLLYISMNVNDWLGNEELGQLPQMRQLIIAFFMAIFLSATQNIVIDGWSLTMLQKRNVGYASTCNHVGSLLGNFLGFVPFMLFNSRDYITDSFGGISEDRGYMNFADFLLFWSLIFMVSTTLVWLFKYDRGYHELNEEYECRVGFLKCYKRLWEVIHIKPVIQLCFILFTCDMGFAAINAIAPLKLMDIGVARDKFVLLTIPSLPVLLILPFVFSRHLNGPQSVDTFLYAYTFKLIFAIVYALFIFISPLAKRGGEYPHWYCWVLLFIYNVDHMSDFIRILAAGAFFRRKCDSRFGGIYISLFSVVSHIGTLWSESVSLWLVDKLTVWYCVRTNALGHCRMYLRVQGFYVEILICLIIGLTWFCFLRKLIRRLGNSDIKSWRIDWAAIDYKG